MMVASGSSPTEVVAGEGPPRLRAGGVSRGVVAEVLAANPDVPRIRAGGRKADRISGWGQIMKATR